MTQSPTSLRHNYKVTRFYFHHMMGTKIAMFQSAFNTRGFPSLKLPIVGMTSRQRCLRHSTKLLQTKQYDSSLINHR
jgi:hypothetical protein